MQIRRLFPGCTVHLIEPQPACYEASAKFTPVNGFYIHRCALASPSEPGRKIRLAMDPNGVTPGAHITFEDDARLIEIAAATMDELLAKHLRSGERCFLKLDLQGFELEALAGSKNTLRSTEVILMEVSFYAQAYEPPMRSLFGSWMKEISLSMTSLLLVAVRAMAGLGKATLFSPAVTAG